MWKIIKDLNNTKKYINHFNLVDDSGKLIKDSQQVANNFNNHFTNIAIKIIKKYSKPNYNTISIDTYKNENSSMYIKKTNKNEIIEIISNLKPNSAPGLDDIRINQIKKIKNVISYYLSLLINKSIDFCYFPSELKIAKITPVYKDGDKNDVNNYRPISVLPVFSKINEKILYNRLILFLTDINFITQFQHGFLKKKSTEIAVNELFNFLYQKFDKKCSIRGLFLDYRKAFDVVGHNILLKKMFDIGIQNKPWHLFQNYLSERYQITIINNIQSDKKLINYGVPQGSILGPLLFLIYINDISLINLKGKLSIYADDVALFYSGDNKKITLDTNHDINQIENWCNQNNFFLNENKCFYMDFGNTNIDSPNIKINNVKIKKVNNFKYLGLIIDSQLNFKDHINYIIIKLCKWAGLFRRFAFYLNSHTKRLIYFSYVHSNLIYLASVWGQGNKTNLEKLQRCQNRVIKILFNFPYEMSSNRIYKNTLFLNISEIIFLQNVTLIQKIKFNYIKTNLNLTNRNDIHQYSTRNCLDFNYSSTNTNKAKNAITHNGIILYNSLPETIKLIPIMKNFNKKLKEYILNKRNQH